MNTETILHIYRCFILPILEYASEVWDGCSKAVENRLESIQLDVARLPCGLPIFCNKTYLYKETCLEPLVERRKRRKMFIFYKIQNGMTSEYVSGLIPNLLRDENAYPLRNRNNVIQRLSTTERLFIPSTIALWNNLPDEIRESDTMLSFKSRITPVVEKMPPYFEIGHRKLIIVHARLRNFYSNLNYDLFRVNLTADSSCACGNPCKRAFHFFL